MLRHYHINGSVAHSLSLGWSGPKHIVSSFLCSQANFCPTAPPCLGSPLAVRTSRFSLATPPLALVSKRLVVCQSICRLKILSVRLSFRPSARPPARPCLLGIDHVVRAATFCLSVLSACHLPTQLDCPTVSRSDSLSPVASVRMRQGSQHRLSKTRVIVRV
jgi:hypothetical protein